MSKAVLKGSAGPWVLAASTEECILGNKSGSKTSEKSERFQQPPKKCPECSSLRIWKDGLRYVKSETGSITVQRYICRDCGRRFSETEAAPPSPHRRKLAPERKKNDDLFGSYLKPNTTAFKANGLTSTCQVCVSDAEMENLAKVETRQKQPMREGTKPDAETTEGLIVRFMAWLEAQGYNCDGYLRRIKRLAVLGANLLDPEDVKRIIAEQPWKNSCKALTVHAYNAFTQMQRIDWIKPKYRVEQSLPFVAEERELDQLIAASRSKRTMTFLQCLKETFADPGEILGLRWIDINSEHRIISINHPVKGHDAGQAKVSSKLIAMLNVLPKKSDRVFACTYAQIHGCYVQLRKRVARRLQNPRISEIRFTTFRHWGGTMLAHVTNGNVLAVKKALRHKRIENTMKYIHLAQFREDDEFEVEIASTVEEIKKLVAVGFQKADEIHGIHVFKRPKRFSPQNFHR